MADNRKYIFQNGVAMINPNYQANPNALVVVSTMEEQANVAKLGVPQQFQDAINIMQAPTYIAGFQAGNDIDGGMLIDGLMNIFAQNEIPIGLVSKLTPLQGATLHFKIDDSGSMASNSNLRPVDACWYTKQNVDMRRQFLTRWEEAEDRLHTLIDILAYVPTGPIILSFFDRPGQYGGRLNLDRTGKIPTDFAAFAHAEIHKMFIRQPAGNTPILLNMKNMLNEANSQRAFSDKRTMHYILTDGEPSGGSDEIDQIKNLLVSQGRFASSNPLTFLGCSNDRSDYAWMHEMEEIAPFVAALPDFRDEVIEVANDQGIAFPYTRGFWLLCNVAASINPNDLDELDQHAPLTKPILDNLMGRILSEPEFRHYFNLHPNASRVFGPDYNLFLTAQFPRDIPTVQLFLNTIAQRLGQDMDEGDDDADAREEKYAESVVLNSRRQATVNVPQATVTQYPAMYATRPRVVPDNPDPDLDRRNARRNNKSCCTLI